MDVDVIGLIQTPNRAALFTSEGLYLITCDFWTVRCWMSANIETVDRHHWRVINAPRSKYFLVRDAAYYEYDTYQFSSSTSMKNSSITRLVYRTSV